MRWSSWPRGPISSCRVTAKGMGNTDGKPTRKERHDALTWAEGEYHTCLRTSNEGAAAREYLESRGFTRETIERFRLGFAPADGQFLQRRATARFKASQAITAQASTVRLIAARAEGGGYYDYFRGRVMFPIRDPRARTVGVGDAFCRAPQPMWGNTSTAPRACSSRRTAWSSL